MQTTMYGNDSFQNYNMLASPIQSTCTNSPCRRPHDWFQLVVHK
jgi:hypothetical protein